MKIKKKQFALFFFFILIVSYFPLTKIINALPPSKNGDNAIYFNSAYNLSKFKILSHQIEEFRVSAYKSVLKPPLYSFVLSLGFKSEDLKQSKLNCVYEQIPQDHCKSLLISSKKIINLTLHYILSISVFITIFLISRNKIYSLLGFIIIFYSTYFMGQINNYMTETLAAILLLWHSYFLFRTIQSNYYFKINFLLSAFFLGLLILCKAIYLYWFYIILFFCFIYFMKIQINKKLKKFNFPYHLKFKKELILIFFVTTMLIYSPWMIRNFLVDGNLNISSQGGNVIAERAEFLNYNYKKYHYGFIWYLPNSNLRKKLINYYNYKKFYKFDESHPESFYGLSDDENKGFILSKLKGRDKDNSKKIFSKSLEEINNYPFKNSYLTLLMIYRGSFINTTDNNFPNYLKVFSSLTHWPAVIMIIIFFIYGLISKKRFIFFLSPSLFAILSYASLTDFESRYASIFIPIFIIQVSLYLYENSNFKIKR